MLARIFERETSLRVVETSSGDKLLPGTVYIAPADQHMWVEDNDTVAMSDGRKINYLQASADPLLNSIADRYGRHAIGIVLTGGGRNGVNGAKALHDAGGLVLAQDQASSAHFGMPRAAIEAGAVDRVLPLATIGLALLDLTHRQS